MLILSKKKQFYPLFDASDPRVHCSMMMETFFSRKEMSLFSKVSFSFVLWKWRDTLNQTANEMQIFAPENFAYHSSNN